MKSLKEMAGELGRLNVEDNQLVTRKAIDAYYKSQENIINIKLKNIKLRIDYIKYFLEDSGDLSELNNTISRLVEENLIKIVDLKSEVRQFKRDLDKILKVFKENKTLETSFIKAHGKTKGAEEYLSFAKQATEELKELYIIAEMKSKTIEDLRNAI